MFIIEKTVTISAAHQLELPYDSPCNALHGHNYKIKVTLAGETDVNGMVCDFSLIGNQLKQFDHTNLNIFFSPATAEMFASGIADRINNVLEAHKNKAKCVKVEVSETEGNVAIWYDETYMGPAF